MAVTWQRTDLSTTPAYFEMADTDRKALPFTAPAGFVVDTAESTLEAYPDFTGVVEPIESTTVNGGNDGAVVVVSGLTRDTLYRLTVTMTAADTTTETGVLVIRCVA